jgi:hypothetical protein
MTTGAVLSPGLKSLLNFWNPAGSLTDKTTMGILAWLISWIFLNSSLKDKDFARHWLVFHFPACI